MNWIATYATHPRNDKNFAQSSLPIIRSFTSDLLYKKLTMIGFALNLSGPLLQFFIKIRSFHFRGLKDREIRSPG